MGRGGPRCCSHSLDSTADAQGATPYQARAQLTAAPPQVNRAKAAAIDLSKPAYDVLLDDYEKGMTSARLDEIFSEVTD